MTDVASWPVPKDLPLPLPAPEWVLVATLVFFFLVHIVFVNLMVGSAWLSFYYQLKGLKNKAYDNIAYALTETITVNKSLAVVMGVGPLLAINTLYTLYFYSANGLTGYAWAGVVPLVAGTFLLTYLHKYCWHKMEDVKPLHVALGGVISGLFLFIPLIFLTQITLMLAPDRWTQVQGFFSAMMVPNVFARYSHFVLGSLAFTGLFMAWLFKQKDDAAIAKIGFSRGTLIKKGYAWAFWATALQFLVGPMVILTLPDVSRSIVPTYGMVGVGVVLAVLALAVLRVELARAESDTGKSLKVIVLLLAGTVLLMGSGRHMYRESAIADHKLLVAKKTALFVEESAKAAAAAKPAAE